MKSLLWIPNGKLSDGTMLFGPLSKKPEAPAFVLEVNIDGVAWFVGLSREGLEPALCEELEAWARERVKSYQKK